MKKLVFFVSLVGLVACGGGGGGSAGIPGSELPPLEDGQKTRMEGFSQEMGVSQGTGMGKMLKTSGRLFQGIDQEGIRSLAASLQAGKALPARSVSDGQKIAHQKQQKMEQDLEQALSDGHCDLVISEMPESMNTQSTLSLVPALPIPMLPAQNDGHFDITFGGEIGGQKSTTCPVYYKLAVNLSGNVPQGEQAVGDMAINFSAENIFRSKNGTAFYNDLMVYGYESNVSGGFQMNVNQVAQSLTLSGNMSGTSVVQTKPDFEGDVTFTMSGSLQGAMSEQSGSAAGSLTMSYEFRDFKATGHITFSMTNDQEEPVVAYFVNGQSVEEQEFIDLFMGVFAGAMEESTSLAN